MKAKPTPNSTFVTKIPIISLKGNDETILRSLGKKDRIGYHEAKSHFEKLGTLHLPLVSSIFRSGLDHYAKRSLDRHPDFAQKLEHYTQGLGVDFDDILPLIFLPELMSSGRRWNDALGRLSGRLFGCTSVLGQGLHARVLDVALVDSFDRFERVLITHGRNEIPALSIGTAGLPLHGQTGMNKAGLTLAVHHRWDTVLNHDGLPVFEIAHRLLTQCKTLRDAEIMLKELPSIGRWNLYMSDRNGDLLTAQLKGKRHSIRVRAPQKRPWIATNADRDPDLTFPPNFVSLCADREELVRARLAKETTLTPAALLAALGGPSGTEGENGSDWVMGPVTPASVQSVVLSPKKNECWLLPGPAPKMDAGTHLRLAHPWTRPTLHVHTAPTSLAPRYADGLRRLARAQSAWDRHDLEEAHHHIQMSIALLHSYPESAIAKFYFLVWAYLESPDEKGLESLVSDFIALEGQLPPYLEDHRRLFLLRCDILLKGKTRISEKHISHPILKAYAAKEKKRRPIVLKGLRKLILPRIDILDILHLY